MARLRNNVLRWGNKLDGPDTYKQGRQGALDDAYWDEDEPVDFPKKSRKKKVKKKRGCPGNDFKAHVYVWVTETHYYAKWTSYGWVEDRSRTYTVDVKRCCGCDKVYNRRYHW